MKIFEMRSGLIYFCAVIVFLALSSCQKAGGDFPGREYVPDMGHSISYQANYYNFYSLNTWGTEGEYYQLALPRTPVEGTLPIGMAGLSTAVDPAEADEMRASLQGFDLSGSVPYYYEDTEEGRQRAAEEIIDNPFPITERGLAMGKEMYEIYCGICHGNAGDGLGYLVRDDGGVYPAAPTSFLLDEWVSASNGQYYHAIMHGRNVMGAYNDKLSYEERWQVIHYIRSLQADAAGLAYSEDENTLNEIDIPAGLIQ